MYEATRSIINPPWDASLLKGYHQHANLLVSLYVERGTVRVMYKTTNQKSTWLSWSGVKHVHEVTASTHWHCKPMDTYKCFFVLIQSTKKKTLTRTVGICWVWLLKNLSYLTTVSKNWKGKHVKKINISDLKNWGGIRKELLEVS